MKSTKNNTAIIIGASMAGLVTARVLSDHFETVCIIERDKVIDQPEPRKGQPQAHHIHTLLAKGSLTLRKYFPDIFDSLKQGGASIYDSTDNMIWNCYGDYRLQFNSGIIMAIMSRPFLEMKIRECVLNLENVEVISGYSVEDLITDNEKHEVIGIQISKSGQFDAARILKGDLVVDTSGRGSCSGKWLEKLGYDKPAESKVGCGIGYTSRIYSRNPKGKDGSKWVCISPEPPKDQRGGAAFPVEGDRWIVSLCGWHGDHAPTDDGGFEEFAKNLPVPDLYNIISQNEPLSNYFIFKYPYSLRRHYEKLNRFPQDYLVLGDAVCSFNPVYGQGMTSTILQADTLNTVLNQRKGELKNIAKSYFQQISKVIDNPWMTAVGEDFRYPQTTGKKSFGTNLINNYLTHIHRSTHSDPVVSKAFFSVLNMLESPFTLFRPQIIGKVLMNSFK